MGKHDLFYSFKNELEEGANILQLSATTIRVILSGSQRSLWNYCQKWRFRFHFE